MRPGMSAKSLIEVDRYLGVLVVPVALIIEKEGRSFVQVVGLSGEKDELREIQIRISDGTTAVISSGLKEGEKIRSKPTLTT
jgi:multidrug efflux pump subunit AcrA (membrane-fusion protein)